MTVIGVSLKMYFGHEQTRQWCRRVAALPLGGTELFVIPTFVSIPAALDAFRNTTVKVGAQDLFWEDRGAYTGEVSGAELAELGVGVVEVGHAERRRLFGETQEVVDLKAAAALRHGLTPVLCIGEVDRGEDAVAQCRAQLSAVTPGDVIVAYEPVWAIGAAEPAPVDHIRAVCSALKADGHTVIYGGSAGPGLLTELGHDVDGLFLGRFAHDPEALAAVIEEARAR